MITNLITVEDLERFKKELLEEIKLFWSDKQLQQANIKLLKSHQVMRMLAISPGTLQHMRINGSLPYIKIGGVIFYDLQDIERMLKENKRKGVHINDRTTTSI